MLNFLQVNKLKNKLFGCLLFCMLCFFSNRSFGQQDTFDFGVGPFISVGLQQEWAIQLRAGYHTFHKFYYLAEYSSYFRRNKGNNEQFSEIGLSVNYPIFKILRIKVFGGLGYVLYLEPINKSGSDTTTFFINSGDVSHGLQLKFNGRLPLSERLYLFAEYNFKSFGKRFDTFGFGLLYSIEFM
ncbi:MAG: hypothetical protein CVU03_03800 [Bacteroidetes bacterium HGW-Bacteroidetes-2]|jgi:hypothetical protein|nr:MAG: hypothetical protein CVU03_03800 [Bacteroidetes bacterium HGW-Bacteroidetes-2]